jgi:hypothetical protein
MLRMPRSNSLVILSIDKNHNFEQHHRVTETTVNSLIEKLKQGQIESIYITQNAARARS